MSSSSIPMPPTSPLTPVLHEAVASGKDIHAIVSRIEETLQGTPRGHAVIATLSIAIMLMNPEIGPEELQDVLTQSSQFMCMLLSTGPQASDQGEKSLIIPAN